MKKIAVVLALVSLLSPVGVEAQTNSQVQSPTKTQADKDCAALAAYAQMDLENLVVPSMYISCNPDPAICVGSFFIMNLSKKAEAVLLTCGCSAETANLGRDPSTCPPALKPRESEK